jgi:membrane-associated phospholipid phosphatase
VLLSLYFKNKYVTGLFMIIAILVGISRIYLLQHFFVDIYFGSIIGFLNGIFVFTWIASTALKEKPSWNRGLFKK